MSNIVPQIWGRLFINVHLKVKNERNSAPVAEMSRRTNFETVLKQQKVFINFSRESQRASIYEKLTCFQLVSKKCNNPECLCICTGKAVVFSLPKPVALNCQRLLSVKYVYSFVVALLRLPRACNLKLVFVPLP